jgi:hypothetical protein
MKITVTFEIDCTRTAEALEGGNVHDLKELLRSIAERKTGLWLQCADLPGDLIGDPVTGLPEVTVEVRP